MTRTPDLLITKPIPVSIRCSARVWRRFSSKISRSGNFFRVPLPHNFSHRSATWVTVWVWSFRSNSLKICATLNNVGSLRKLNRSLVAEARKPSVATCEGLGSPRVKDVASEDAGETTGSVSPVWAEIWGGSIMGSISRGKTVRWVDLAAAFGGKSGDFGQPKKVLDKGPPW